VEGAHAGLKAILRHSGGNMDKAFESIDRWYHGMVKKKKKKKKRSLRNNYILLYLSLV
jgi:hypothetical protein